MKARWMCACLLALLAMVGCNLPGKPGSGPEVPRPEAVRSFDTLFAQNCAGCHGKTGEYGSAMALANPEYEALVDDGTLRDVISNGEKGTLMPAFNVKSGGLLTDEQIELLIHGMRERWGKTNAFGGATPPPYKAAKEGDTSKGAAGYADACARCHGENAQKPGKAGSILDGSFLALVNEQMIRTTVIAGRPDLAQPDWRGNIQSRAMTDEEITNLTAWMMSQRPATPGQPYGKQ
jgi:cytochrome c oxidase cbb3-type subunit 3/ubiquinol-cytochrome c reductase cytochrome c subunit